VTALGFERSGYESHAIADVFFGEISPAGFTALRKIA
jgi:hypothetical protein